MLLKMLRELKDNVKKVKKIMYEENRNIIKRFKKESSGAEK
jgi:hypothetical protein